MKTPSKPSGKFAKFSLWGWIPKTILAIAEALKRISLIHHYVSLARLEREKKEVANLVMTMEKLDLGLNDALRVLGRKQPFNSEPPRAGPRRLKPKLYRAAQQTLGFGQHTLPEAVGDQIPKEEGVISGKRSRMKRSIIEDDRDEESGGQAT